MEDPGLALVTGGAHRLGRAIALSLARLGYSILLHYWSSQEKAKLTAGEIMSLGVGVSLVQADLKSETGINQLLSALDSQLSIPGKGLRILVNSASVMPKLSFQSTTAADWDAILGLNLRAPFLLAKQVVERMKGGGMIINISDSGAQKLWTGFPAYVVSKSALETLTRLMAKNYAPHIRVNAIAPGLVLPKDGEPSEDWDILVKRSPLRRPVTPDEIGSCLEFLIRNEAVTGQTIRVDGGFSLT